MPVTERPVSHRYVLATMLAVVCAPIIPATAATPPQPAETLLHLVQRTEIAVGGRRPAVTEDHQLYVDGKKLVIRSAKSWLLVRQDLQTAWVMDADRRAISRIPVSQLGAPAALAVKGLAQPPAFRATGETKTIAGLACRIYRGALKEITVEACLTRELVALERFQALLGGPHEVPGVALELIVSLEHPGKERVTFTQRVTRVTIEPLDQALFAPPVAPPQPPQKR